MAVSAPISYSNWLYREVLAGHKATPAYLRQPPASGMKPPFKRASRLIGQTPADIMRRTRPLSFSYKTNLGP
jgi:hypothetical protein